MSISPCKKCGSKGVFKGEWGSSLGPFSVKCSGCGKKALDLAGQLYQLIGDPDIHLHSLLLQAGLIDKT